MKYITIKPILGTRNNCPIDSPSMLKVLDEGIFLTHDTGGKNFDLEREKDSCSKSFGRAQWDTSANAQATKCLGLHELWDGTNRAHWYFDNGKVYRYDSSLDPAEVAIDSTTFANDDQDLYSVITFGGYMVFADRGEHTPYKSDHDDSALTKLIQSGTEYKFRYLLPLLNRIFAAYSDQTNGDIEIRYTDALPTWATLSFPAKNQLYKVGSNSPISGIASLTRSRGYLFSEDDIVRLEHTISGTPPVRPQTAVKGWGSVNHHCIASDGTSLYFFDRDHGFCRYSDNLAEPQVISDPYEMTVARIPSSYYNRITHAVIPRTNEIAWNVPVDSDTTPSIIIFYNTKTGQWRHEVKSARFLNVWQTFSGMTWSQLSVLTDDVWPSSKTWSWYTSETKKLVFGNSDGHLYTSTSEGDNATDWACYRIEPILPFPDNQRHKRLLEIWVSIAEKQGHSLDFYWRGGDTVAEMEHASWTSLGSISMDDPPDAVLFTDQTARLHQLKWGTDLKSESFSIPEIKLGYAMQGVY